ncbi:MAG: helix-turn-helix domain-containing protein [Reichenbachiella sp.]|uniref:helix-turn-helix domain-containing protein n=1 Tax=Reichenbachiella sp. TaxID=2184521 RepID=UPI00329932BF
MIRKGTFRVFFQNGIGVYAGHVQETKPHIHHATEIIFGLTGKFSLVDSKNQKKEYTISLIPHDIKHQFINDSQIMPVFIYLDPFHNLAQQLRKSFYLQNDIVHIDTPPTQQIKDRLRLWFNGENINILELTYQLVNQLTDHTSHEVCTDSRILKSLNYIKVSLNTVLRVDDLASKAHLSGSRYAHLFKEQVGIPFRRFVLWSRLQTTIESILEGNSLSSACYDGGFADLSHFTRTFVSMFGVTPSSVLKG